MNIDTTTITSRGQVVIPKDIREDLNLKEGEKLIVLEEDNRIILKPLRAIQGSIEDEILDIKLAQKGWNEIEQGRSTKLSKKEFLKELEQW